MQVLHAEALFVQFVVENNLSFRTGDHFSKLIRSMFPANQNCFDCIPPPELLMLNKNAVWKYNQEHGSHN